MSTLQEQIGGFEWRTVRENTAAAAAAVGGIALIIAAMGLYSAFIVVTTEVFANAGAFESFTPAEMEAFRLIYDLPVAAAMGAAATRVINLLSGREYGLLRGAKVAAGAFFAVAAIHIWLLDMGVIA